MNSLTSPSRNTDYILIHGYTGSASDFGDLEQTLRNIPGARVWCPLLPGHGTTIDDLVGLTYAQIYSGLEQEVARRVSNERQVVLIGVSLGAQVALYLATKYKVAGVVAIAVTHDFRFPLNLTSLGFIGLLKRRWKKHFTVTEREYHARTENFSYQEMLSDGWFLARTLKTAVDRGATHISGPVLFVHSLHEKLADPAAIAPLSRMIATPVTIRLLSNESHNMFYSAVKAEATQHILSFVQHIHTHAATEHPTQEMTTAIIPAYNEAERINTVLRVLTQVSMIDEIIVVDDGSSDHTGNIVRQFPGVTLLTNERNIGKGASMDRGVRQAKNDIIFFCDADLLHFTVADAEAIITPVRERRYDMYIGMRGNFMQRAVRAWGLNSGERALRKEVWHALPAYYKYRYRIEVGLNRHVMKHGFRGLGWKMFQYTQPMKETKYGILRGTFLRWWMNMDVLAAYLLFPVVASFSDDKRRR